MTEDGIREKIQFARNRLDELQDLMARNEFGTAIHLRRQLLQEFFFHLVGAVEYVAQLVKERRDVDLGGEPVAINFVMDALPSDDPLKDILCGLYKNPRQDPMPADPYSDEGYVYRLWNYRNQVLHRGHEPFHLAMDNAGALPTRLDLDPRDRKCGRSTHGVDVDLKNMLDLVQAQCDAALKLC